MGLFALPTGNSRKALVQNAIDNLSLLLQHERDPEQPMDYLIDMAIGSLKDAKNECDVEQPNTNPMPEFSVGDIVKYKGFNDTKLSYKIIKFWDDGYGYYDIEIDDSDKDYDGHFYPVYKSIPYRHLADANPEK